MNRQNIDKFMLRLPNGWREEIKKLAEKNRRSMNAEILCHLANLIDNENNKEKGEAPAS